MLLWEELPVPCAVAWLAYEQIPPFSFTQQSGYQGPFYYFLAAAILRGMLCCVRVADYKPSHKKSISSA
jgi:hypothetical protein